MKKVLAIIPARGGSKGIIGKNLRPLGGIPLISFPIENAKRSKLLTRLVVSTDSEEIGRYVHECGVKVIQRPAEFGTDQSPVIDSVIHVLDELEKTGEAFDIVVLLQPTSPFWTSDQLDEVLSMFEDEDLDGVVSVVPSLEMHPARMYHKDTQDFLSPLLKDGETIRRQELSPVYFRNGCFYAVRTSVLKNSQTLMPGKKRGYLMDPDWFLTIDTPRDLKLAEVMVEEWKEKSEK